MARDSFNFSDTAAGSYEGRKINDCYFRQFLVYYYIEYL